uniref:Uncharacterized protein n=1 Tax=Leersia perrieri TaxID=77586 RepID=A0A0D9VM33_9ORYZ
MVQSDTHTQQAQQSTATEDPEEETSKGEVRSSHKGSEAERGREGRRRSKPWKNLFRLIPRGFSGSLGGDQPQDREINGLNEQLEEDSRVLELLQKQLADERKKRTEIEKENSMLHEQVSMLMNMLDENEAFDEEGEVPPPDSL